MRATMLGAALLTTTALLAVAPSALAQEYPGLGGYPSYSGYGDLGGYLGYSGYYGGYGGYPGYSGYYSGYGGLPGYSGYYGGLGAYPGSAGYGTTGYGVFGQVTCQYAGQYPGYC